MDEDSPFDGLNDDIGDPTDEYTPGTVDVDSTDFEGIAEAAESLLIAYLYHRSSDIEKLGTILYFEYQEQEEYLDNSQYKATIIRQAGFIEYFLTAHLVRRFEEEKGESLSNREKRYLRNNIGHSGRHKLASMLGILSAEEEQAISELIRARTDIAHKPWFLFTEDDEIRFERIAIRIHNVFEDLTEYEGTMEELSESVLDEFED